MNNGLNWSTLSSSTVYTCPGFEVIQDQVLLPDQSKTNFDHIVVPHSVAILPFISSEELIVIHEWKQSVGHLSYGVPSGTVESKDTTLFSAAKRELIEETGYTTDKITPLTTIKFSSGFSNNTVSYFIAEMCSKSSDQHLDPDEFIETSILNIRSLYQSILDGKISDGKLITGVLFYLATRKGGF
jgi:ADP-ribose pyrophosphatase